jgi:hypothetical protein
MSLITPVGVIGAESPAGEALCDALIDAGFARRAVIPLEQGAALPSSIAALGWVGAGWGAEPDSALPEDLPPTLPVLGLAGAGAGYWPWVTGLAALPAHHRLRLVPAVWAVIARLVAALAPHVALTALRGTALLPASEWGQAGVAALGQQTAAVLNFRELPAGVMPQRQAFNVIPMAATPGLNPAQLLALPDLHVPVHLHCWAVPVFVGISGHLLIELDGASSASQMESWLAAALDARYPRGSGEPLGPVELTMVNRLLDWRIEAVSDRVFGLHWTADNLTLGTAEPAAAVMRALLGH